MLAQAAWPRKPDDRAQRAAGGVHAGKCGVATMSSDLTGQRTSIHRSEGQSLGRYLLQPFSNAWQTRELIAAIVWRELSQRFRDSYFGWVWAVLSPLTLLVIYTFVFSNVLNIQDGIKNYALSVFVGLILFNCFSELVTRAPLLLQEHSLFIKKSIFPIEVLAWTSLIRSLTYALIGLVVFFVFQLFLTASVPATALLLPFVLLPFCLFTLGAIWFLAALGAFTRDVAFLIITIIPALLFITPVLYTFHQLPMNVRIFTYINPLTSFIEIARDALLIGNLPDPAVYLFGCVVALLSFYGGYSFFMRFRSVVVDVL
jgi:lipopolysaccharide transport system permease protein